MDSPEQLLREAEAFRAQVGTPDAGKRPVELLVDQAFQLVHADLDAIAQAKAAGDAPDYFAIFHDRFDEKIAAIIFLAKQNLLDIEYGTVQSLETTYARTNLQAMVETLYNVDAVDALIIFFDFAASQREHKPQSLWRNVLTHCLHLMAWMTRHRAAVCRFLAERPIAVEMLIALSNGRRADVAQVFRELYDDYVAQAPESFSPTDTGPAQHFSPVFITLYRQYETLSGSLEEAWAGGAASSLTAKSRISQALATDDIPALIRWIADGTPTAMMEALQGAIAVMSVEKYLDMLEHLLWDAEVDEVRRVTLLCELGTINRRHALGGHPRINNTLAGIASTDDAASTGLARLAVRELYAVHAWKTLQAVAEQSLQPNVAVDLLHAFAMGRKLELLPESFTARVDIRTPLEHVREQLRDIRGLMESAAACPNTEMARFYVDKLRDLHAVPELESLVRQGRITDFALQALHDIQLADAAATPR